ncbi:MAG: flagellar hook-associated protein FlgK [Planctomycetaceae bacterium]|nr:flagellar hook-associated protein FlgK [Planctomycetaceae bacterium]
MRSYEIGLSALRAQQIRIATHGNNIANAATPGYARQVTELVERPQFEYQNLLVGNGVDVASIRSLRDEAAEAALSRNVSLSSSVEAQLNSNEAVESLLSPGGSSIHTYISDVFNSLERVANAPEESTARGEFVRITEAFATEAAFIHSSMEDVQQQAFRDHSTGVGTANTLIDKIAGLNAEIWTSRTNGDEPHSLLTQRDAAVKELSEWVDVRITPLDSGRDVVMIGGGSASFTIEPIELYSEVNNDGELSVQVAPGREVTVTGGRLEGLEIVHNLTVPEAVEELDAFVSEMVRQLDQLHATGLVSPDGYQSLTGVRGPAHASRALIDSELPFPVASGEIYVSVTDQTTGVRETTRVSVSVETESLRDVAVRLSAIDGLNAIVTSGSNQLIIQANEGFSFDFAGRPDNVANKASFAGTSNVTFSGRYAIDVADTAFDPQNPPSDFVPRNQQLTVTVPAAGQIGITPGLQAEVRDDTGLVIQRLNVGAGYTVGEQLSLNNGLSVAFSEGTAVAGDVVPLKAVSNSDTTGLLSALGVNSLFSGRSIASFSVRDDIKANPFLFAASISGEAGDAENAARMSAARDHQFTELDGRTFVETLADITANSGLNVQQLQNDRNRLDAYGSQLQTSRDNVSGVDTNEELLHLLAAERAFQAAARFVATYDETVVELLSLFG